MFLVFNHIHWWLDMIQSNVKTFVIFFPGWLNWALNSNISGALKIWIFQLSKSVVAAFHSIEIYILKNLTSGDLLHRYTPLWTPAELASLQPSLSASYYPFLSLSQSENYLLDLDRVFCSVCDEFIFIVSRACYCQAYEKLRRSSRHKFRFSWHLFRQRALQDCCKMPTSPCFDGWNDVELNFFCINTFEWKYLRWHFFWGGEKLF